MPGPGIGGTRQTETTGRRKRRRNEAAIRKRLDRKLSSGKVLSDAEAQWIIDHPSPIRSAPGPSVVPSETVRSTDNPLLRRKAERANAKIIRQALEREVGRVVDPFARQAAPSAVGRGFQTVAESILPGPAIASRLKGEDAPDWQVALDVALLPLPLKGVPTTATAGARILRGFGKGQKLGEAVNEPILRSLRVGEKVQQLPAARSRLTRHVIERPADAVSRAMMGEGKAAKVARKILPTASAEARVAKAAGRENLLNAERAQARMQTAIKALPKEGSAEDIAHFWWAQQPSKYRNVRGLELVREAQRGELAKITSGQALEELRAQMAAIKAALKEADDSERFSLLQALEQTKILITDLPLRAKDLAISLAQIDKVIAKPPAFNPKIVEAMGQLSADRRSLLEAAGVLSPERAAERQSLVSRWLNLDPSGEEVFVGHRLDRVRGARPNLLPAAIGTGKVRLPSGVARANKLVLARSGRLRPSTHVAAEDWQAAQVFRNALKSRADLAKMGRPFDGSLSEGEVLINPKGRAIPPQWKTDKLAKLAEQGYDEDEIAAAAKEIVSGFLATADNASEAMARWAEEGVKWDELRVVPEKTVRRYFGQFTPAHGSSAAGKAYDAAVDFTAASIIFARLGYIPKNILQNLIMAVPHQGVFFIANAPRAAQALAHPELRHLLAGEVGTGATGALATEARFAGKLRGAPQKATGAVTMVADSPLRISAWIHEAAAAGVLPKTKPYLDESDVAKILALFEDPAQRPLLNDIRSRAVEAMADFSRLTPTQRRWSRRLFVIPGWLWAGSRYPFHFAATHPGRSAALAYIAAGEPGAPDELKINKPIDEYLAKDLPFFVEGIDLPGGKTMRTSSISPVSTPWEIAGAVSGRDVRTAGDYANPLAVSAWNIANRTVSGRRGPYRTDYPTAIKRNLERIVPNVALARDLISPPENPETYPQDRSRLGRLAREVGVVPIKIAREESPDKRVSSRVAKDRLALEKELRAGKAPSGLIRATRKSWRLREKLYIARSGIDSKLDGEAYQREALRVEYELARRLRLRPLRGERALFFFSLSPAKRKQVIETWSAENIERLRREISYYVFGGETIAYARRQVRK